MRFSIDIIWLRKDRIVGIEASVPFEKGGNGPTVRPRELIDAVLEVPAGYSAASGWTIGDRVRLERVSRTSRLGLFLCRRNGPLGKLAPNLRLNCTVESIGIDAHHVMQGLIDRKTLANQL